MNSPNSVGRIAALAVALGVSAAVSGGAGVGSADPGTQQDTGRPSKTPAPSKTPEQHRRHRTHRQVHPARARRLSTDRPCSTDQYGRGWAARACRSRTGNYQQLVEKSGVGRGGQPTVELRSRTSTTASAQAGATPTATAPINPGPDGPAASIPAAVTAVAAPTAAATATFAAASELVPLTTPLTRAGRNSGRRRGPAPQLATTAQAVSGTGTGLVSRILNRLAALGAGSSPAIGRLAGAVGAAGLGPPGPVRHAPAGRRGEPAQQPELDPAGLGDRSEKQRLSGPDLEAGQQHQVGQRLWHRPGHHVVQRRQWLDAAGLRRHLQRGQHERRLALQRAAAQR